MSTSLRSSFRAALLGAALAAAAFIGGCTKYYEVSDPASSRTYYSTDVDGSRSGAVKFKDARTGAEVTLQSSEVRELTKEQYEAAVGKK